jgi:hypothetical protein
MSQSASGEASTNVTGAAGLLHQAEASRGVKFGAAGNLNLNFSKIWMRHVQIRGGRYYYIYYFSIVGQLNII